MSRAESLVGKQVDRFKLEQFLAEGPSGLVFKACDTAVNRTIAIKLIPKGGGDAATESELRKRLIAGAQAAGRLSHPNIAATHSYGETEAHYYICMELVAGRTLGQILRERKVLGAEEALDLFEQVLLALDAANEMEVAHQNLKPSNILITEDKRVKLTDFCMARLPSLTMAIPGANLGMPYYMSPEQISGQGVDIRSDIFSVGAILYHAVTGGKAFEGDSTVAVAQRILEVEPAPLRALNAQAPELLEIICNKALQKDPRQRYQTPGEMLKDLRFLKHKGFGAARRAIDMGTTIKSGGLIPEGTTPMGKVQTPEAGGSGSEDAPPTDKIRRREESPKRVQPPRAAERPPKSDAPKPETEESKPAPKPSAAGGKSKRKAVAGGLMVLAVCGVAALGLYYLKMPPGLTGWPFTGAPTDSGDGQVPASARSDCGTVEPLIRQARDQWQGNPAFAQKLLEEATAREPRCFDAALQLARLLRSRGDTQNAIAQYQRALGVNSRVSDAYCELGGIYQSAGNHELAIENYEACWALSPPNLDEVLTNLGASYLRVNRPARAQVLLRQALQINPNNGRARNLLSASLTGQRQGAVPADAQGMRTVPGAAPHVTALPQRDQAQGARGASAPPDPAAGSSPSGGLSSPASPGRGAAGVVPIQIGMLPDEVRRVMGEPQNVYRYRQIIEWEYYTPQGKLEVKFRNGRVAMVEQY